MSARLPRLTAKEVISAIEKKGFSLARQSGSHKVYKNSEGKRVTIPFHGNRTLHPKVLKSVLADADINAEELIKLI